MRTINHDRRAVAIGMIGFILVCLALFLCEIGGFIVQKEAKRVERELWQLNSWIPKGHNFPIWGYPRATKGRDLREEEGPYVITYTVSGREAYQYIFDDGKAADRIRVLMEASKEPGKIVQDIKVFRSYRIDPEELEGSR